MIVVNSGNGYDSSHKEANLIFCIAYSIPSRLSSLFEIFFFDILKMTYSTFLASTSHWLKSQYRQKNVIMTYRFVCLLHDVGIHLTVINSVLIISTFSYIKIEGFCL
jgi:hypothetical protein